jgi:hypothetical protein
MSSYEPRSSSLHTLLAVAFVFHLAAGCNNAGDRGGDVTVRRDINLVKEAHTGELMALPGVVGVYVGALGDGNACIAVMVIKKTRELEQKIPATLEGYPVKIDETGEIKPMR